MIVIHCRVEVRRATVIWANGSWNRRCEWRRRALAAGKGPSNKDLHLRSGAKFCRQVPLRLQNFKLCQHHRRPPQLATVTAISLSCFFFPLLRHKATAYIIAAGFYSVMVS